jgi:hypothetical protein
MVISLCRLPGAHHPALDPTLPLERSRCLTRIVLAFEAVAEGAGTGTK